MNRTPIFDYVFLLLLLGAGVYAWRSGFFEGGGSGGGTTIRVDTGGGNDPPASTDPDPEEAERTTDPVIDHPPPDSSPGDMVIDPVQDPRKDGQPESFQDDHGFGDIVSPVHDDPILDVKADPDPAQDDQEPPGVKQQRGEVGGEDHSDTSNQQDSAFDPDSDNPFGGDAANFRDFSL